MLQKSHLLLEIFWVICECILFSNVLPVSVPSFHIVKVESVWVKANFSGVIEEDTGGFVAQAIAKTILWRVIHPFLHPNLVILWLCLEALSWCLVWSEIILSRCWVLWLASSAVQLVWSYRCGCTRSLYIFSPWVAWAWHELSDVGGRWWTG